MPILVSIDRDNRHFLCYLKPIERMYQKDMTLYFQVHIQMKESILKECSGIDNTKIV